MRIQNGGGYNNLHPVNNRRQTSNVGHQSRRPVTFDPECQGGSGLGGDCLGVLPGPAAQSGHAEGALVAV